MVQAWTPGHHYTYDFTGSIQYDNHGNTPQYTNGSGAVTSLGWDGADRNLTVNIRASDAVAIIGGPGDSARFTPAGAGWPSVT